MDEKKAALIASTLASFLTPFMASSVNLALPSISGEFALDAIAISWIGMAFLVTAAAFLIPAGRLGDIYGRKRVFSLGLMVYSGSSLLAACSVSGLMLIAARALQGTGGALLFGTGIAILTSVYPAAERGKVLGYNVAAVYLGLSLGPVVGGFITQSLGWRSIFLASALLGTMTMLIVTRFLRGEWAEARHERFDATGAILFSLALGMLMVGFSLLPGLAGSAVIAGGAFMAALFLRHQASHLSPLLDIRLFSRNTVFVFSNIAALINYSATYAVTFLISLYLQYIKGLSPRAAGVVLICQPAVMALCSPLAGRLSDRVEPRIVASTGMAVIAVGLWLLTGIDGETPIGLVAAELAVLGLGFGLFSSPNTNAVMSSVEKRLYGVASSVLGSMRLIGQTVSMGIVTILLSLLVGRAAITPALYPALHESSRRAFLVFSVLCIAGVFASLARGRVRAGERPGSTGDG